MDYFNLIIPSFIAGILTFLAPCTLPLVPGYLSFISGVSIEDIQNPGKAKQARIKIFINGVFYVIGFSLVFILLGTLVGLGGAALIKYRFWLSRIGGIFVIFFGLSMLNILKIPFLAKEGRLKIPYVFERGKPLTSLILGSAFAFGWTPCIGPVLGSVLFLASFSTTLAQGTMLLTVFSLGLAVPFLIVALSIGSASKYLSRISNYANVISAVGGIFLVLLGILLFTDSMSLLVSYGYRLFRFIDYERLTNYL